MSGRTHIDIDPFLAGKGPELVHENAFSHGFVIESYISLVSSSKVQGRGKARVHEAGSVRRRKEGAGAKWSDDAMAVGARGRLNRLKFGAQVPW